MRPYTFSRYADHQVAPKESVNDLQAAIETIDAGGTNFASGGGAVATLSDVTLTSPATGEVLKYNSTTSKWVNGVDQTSSGSSIPGETTVAAPTGVSATDTANIASAISTAGAGGVLRFRPGTYLTSGLTANQNDQTWLLPPTCIIKGATGIAGNLLQVTADRVSIIGGQWDYTLGPANGTAIRAQGAAVGAFLNQTTLSAGVNVGVKSITVASATGMTAGAILLLRSQWDNFNPESTSYNDRRAEFVTIDASYVSGTTIPLTNELRDDYLITGGAVNVYRLNFINAPQLLNMRVTGGGAGQVQFGIVVYQAKNPLVRDCDVNLCDYTAINIANCLGGTVDHCATRYAAQSPGAGYGTLITGSENVTVSNGWSTFCLTGFEISGGHESVTSNLARNVVFSGSHALDSSWNGFSAHGGGEHLSWLGCHATRCGFCFSTHGRHNTYVDCHANGMMLSAATAYGKAVTFGGGAALGAYRWIGGVIDCRASTGVLGTMGFYSDSINAAISDVLISGAKIFGFTQHGIGILPAFVGAHANIRIRDCVIDGSSMGGGNNAIIFGQNAGSNLDGNTYTDVDLLDNTILMAATSNLAILINGNVASTTGNRTKRIRVAGNRIKGGTNTFGVTMTTGYFDGTEIVIEQNDFQNVTSHANIANVTVAQWSAMPVARGNLINQSGTANGRGVVGTGTAAPTVGTYLVGDVVLNSSPAAAGTYGWVCTTAGTSGTWRPFGGIT